MKPRRAARPIGGQNLFSSTESPDGPLGKPNDVERMKGNRWGWAVALVALAFAGCGESSTPDRDRPCDAWTAYGADFAVGETVDFGKVVALLDASGEMDGQFEVDVLASCTQLGCWMSVRGPKGEPIKVYMKDHAFFVPTSGMAGKRALVAGTAYRDTVSVALQKRLLAEAGRPQAEIDAVTKEQIEWAISAVGVKIEHSRETVAVPD